MEIQFLGTSAGAPTRTRSVSASVLKYRNSKKWYLIDCGDGTLRQILKAGLSLERLQAVFITHVHGDHCYGLPALLSSAALAGRHSPLLIVGPNDIETFVRVVARTTALHLPFELLFCPIDFRERPLDLVEFNIKIIELSHRVPSYAYIFTENQFSASLNKDRLIADGLKPGPLWSRLQKGRDVQLPDGRFFHSADYLDIGRRIRSVAFCGDNDRPEILASVIDQVDVLIHEATYTEEIANSLPSVQHSSARSVCEFAEQAAIKNLLLTHFSPRFVDFQKLSPSIVDIENEARQYYSGQLFLARDFDIYSLDVNSVLTASLLPGNN